MEALLSFFQRFDFPQFQSRTFHESKVNVWLVYIQLSRKSRLRYWLASHISSFLLHLPNHIARTCLKIMLERNSGKAAKDFYSDIKGESNTDLMTLSWKNKYRMHGCRKLLLYLKRKHILKASKNVKDKYLHFESHQKSCTTMKKDIC